jgi:hypothetical protein
MQMVNAGWANQGQDAFDGEWVVKPATVCIN